MGRTQNKQKPLLTELMNMCCVHACYLNFFVFGCGLMNGQSGWLIAMLGDFETVVEPSLMVWMAAANEKLNTQGFRRLYHWLICSYLQGRP